MDRGGVRKFNRILIDMLLLPLHAAVTATATLTSAIVFSLHGGLWLWRVGTCVMCKTLIWF